MRAILETLLERLLTLQVCFYLRRFDDEKKELGVRKAKLVKENEVKKARLEELEKQVDDFITVRTALFITFLERSRMLTLRDCDGFAGGKGDSIQDARGAAEGVLKICSRVTVCRARWTCCVTSVYLFSPSQFPLRRKPATTLRLCKGLRQATSQTIHTIELSSQPA